MPPAPSGKRALTGTAGPWPGLPGRGLRAGAQPVPGLGAARSAPAPGRPPPALPTGDVVRAGRAGPAGDGGTPGAGSGSGFGAGGAVPGDGVFMRCVGAGICFS